MAESELFGHETGAFTGATTRKLGRFELADGGTLFLDKIAELAPTVQAKLLRALQECEIERLGSTRPIPGRRAHPRRNQPTSGSSSGSASSGRTSITGSTW